MRRWDSVAVWTAMVLISVGGLRAQRGGNDWMTTGFDAQRSSWVRNDGKIGVETFEKPGFSLVWKMKIEAPPRQLNTTTPPALLDFYIGYRGFRTLGFIGVSAGRVIGVDTDLARVEWDAKLPEAGAGQSTLPCPGGMTSAVTRPTATAYPPVPSGRGPGRGSPAKSGVGEPYEGSVTLQAMAAAQARRPPVSAPKPTRAQAAAAAIANPFSPRIQWVLALGGDGKLHMMYVSNGHQPDPAAAFVPAGARAMGLMAYDNVAYVATTGGCGGAAPGVWAMDLNTKKVANWKSPAKEIAGTAGPAAGPDGTLYAAFGAELTALDPKTLAPRGAYSTGGAAFTSSPVVFEFKGKDLVAATAADGRLHVADTANLGAGAVVKSPVYSAPGYQAGSVTSWQDPSGVRWLLVAAGGPAATGAGFGASNGKVANGTVVAWKLVESGGALSLQPGWASRDMISPLPPMVVNGVVFALSSGEFRGAATASDRARRSKPAVLYALDGANGKELWSSGGQIASLVHSGGLAAGGSRVYVASYDGTQYAFGIPMEH